MILDVISLGLDEVDPLLLAREFDGLACGVKYSDGTAQSDIDHPRAFDWLLRTVDWVMYDSRFFLASSCQCNSLCEFIFTYPKSLISRGPGYCFPNERVR